MTKPYLIPFKAEHWMHFVELGVSYQVKFRDALNKENNGPGFTAIYEDQILACAGIIIHHPGMGYAWSILSSLSNSYPIWMTRTIKHILYDIKRNLNLHRVELIVESDKPNYQKWAKILGFTQEVNGRAQMFTSDKIDIIRYELIT